MNLVSKSDVDRFAFKAEGHPHPFMIVWADKTFLPVVVRCLVTLKIRPYSEDIDCAIFL